MTVLRANDLGFAYGEHVVLDRVELELLPGSLTLLAGRNGAGKSTLLALLAGIRAPGHGEVRLGDEPIRDYPARGRARLVTMIPQDSDTSFEFTAREVVMMGRHPHLRRFGGAQPGDHEAVAEALRTTDTTQFAGRSVQTLSGGELRRIHIARALATQAPVLLADEPTVNLDLEHAVAILAMLRDLADAGRTVLVSSHDLNLIAPHCDRVALLHDGAIHSSGTPEDVLRDATVAEVFGVRSGAASGFFPREFGAL